MKKEEPFCVFKRYLKVLLYFGILFIVVFVLIFFIIAIITKRIDFYSFFYHNIKNHIGLTILSGFHVSLLGFGILIVLFSFYNMTLEVLCFKDRFILSLFLEKNKIIEYNIIKSLNVSICYFSYDAILTRRIKKECRVYINNSIHSFYFCYPVEGYFDDIVICSKREKDDLTKRVIADRKRVINLLKLLKSKNDLNIPYLPEEAIIG